MPRSREQIRKAAEDTERWLDSLDPAAMSAPEADAHDLRKIGAALGMVAQGELRLAQAVVEARKQGRTWTQIAMVLGVSRQSARERFGQLVDH
ncbi:MAG: sigma-70 family RNA polymerase sigma factor [Sciscionella sp.]